MPVRVGEGGATRTEPRLAVGVVSDALVSTRVTYHGSTTPSGRSTLEVAETASGEKVEATSVAPVGSTTHTS